MKGGKKVKQTFIITTTMSHCHSLNLQQNGKQMLLTSLMNDQSCE